MTFEIIIPIENVPELRVGATAAEIILTNEKTENTLSSETNRVPKSAEEVPESAEDIKLEKLDEQQSKIYNYVLANKFITTKDAKVLLGLQDRRAREILANMCDIDILMKVGATSNLKYVLKK